MADIDINTGIALKADLNQLYGDVAMTLAQFKEDRRFNRKAYEELLEKYGTVVKELERVRTQLNELVDSAHARKLPSPSDIQTVGAMAGLLGAVKPDGSVDLQKMIDIGNQFGSKV